MQPDTQKIQQQIIHLSKALGFSQIGFTNTDLSAHKKKFVQALRKKHHGTMHYMQKNIKKRLQPDALFPGGKTIISVSMDYLPESIDQSLHILQQQNKAYISRYALGKDYHKIMRKKMKLLAEQISALLKPHHYRVFSDSAPVLEKPIAQKAGLGWIGKHTNLISHRHGSYFFLGEIMTDAQLPTTQNTQTDHCANCTKCISACPTQAIIAPYQLDAKKCISYLTIELHGEIPEKLRPLIGNRIYGCDDCQLVCPWNKFATLSHNMKFHAHHQLDNQTLTDLFQWSEETFKQKTQGSPIARIGYPRWIRNIAVALGNAPRKTNTLKILQNRQHFPDHNTRKHIQWAIQQQSIHTPKPQHP